jgi:LPXTG-site transpeptidase (sortase) family protein
MRWFKLHTWVVAIGLIVTCLGLANAASAVLALSPSEMEVEDLIESAETGGWLEGLAGEYQTENFQDQLDKDLDFGALPAPSASFLAQTGTEAMSGLVNIANDQLLSELYEAEMLYPQDIAEQIAALPTPAAPEIPLRLVIPAIELDAPVQPAEAEIVTIGGASYQLWHAPDQFGVGWHITSAPLGVVGNTVLNGHHNVKGEVFKRLVDLEPGDQVIVESESASYSYVIVNRMILPERFAPLEERIANAQWILPSEDERLTLITCWPYESNTHRLILVARPDR